MAEKEKPKEIPKVVPENELEQKILEAFSVFDHTGKQVVDIREIGTILRSLGCCPTEEEVQQVITMTESKEAEDMVMLIDFMPFMVKVFMQHRFYPASADELLEAFKYFDKQNLGYLTKEEFIRIMTDEGEPFMPEEIEETLQTALDPVTNTITYEYYINQLLVCPKDVYDVADAMEEERKRLEKLAPKKKRASEMLRGV